MQADSALSEWKEGKAAEQIALFHFETIREDEGLLFIWLQQTYLLQCGDLGAFLKQLIEVDGVDICNHVVEHGLVSGIVRHFFNY